MSRRQLEQERTKRFERDFARLAKKHQAEEFAVALRQKFMPAANRFVENPVADWPKGLRVKRVVNSPGIWEFSWSMANPDGRATFEWIELGGNPAIRWRRVGDHSILESP